MDESKFVMHSRSPEHQLGGDCEGKIQFSSSVEEQFLQSISIQAPLPKILNEICIALDCHIGSVVSLISLPGDDPVELAAMALNAARFGLNAFCSEEIVAENAEPLGYLEMYCSLRRKPSAGELQFIERAKYLAAIAIKRHHEAGQQGNCGNRPARGRLLEWPVPMN
jgi:GAF domain-containing protein